MKKSKFKAPGTQRLEAERLDGGIESEENKGGGKHFYSKKSTDNRPRI